MPPRGARARFAPGFGQRVLLTVDTEEEFDWNAPFSASGYGLDHVRRLGDFQQFCEGLGVSPLYLVDWPIANSDMAVELIGDAVRRGKAEVGIQLHPWVNPPHEEELNTANSFVGNLPHALERAKFSRLRDKIVSRFGVAPLTYRAGRYGLGPASCAMLIEGGVAIDTSVRSLFDYSGESGPDFSRHPVWPYWADQERQLLELPVTSVFWGMLRRQGAMLDPLARRMPGLGGVLARLGLLERIALTPEGVTGEEALRGIDMAVDDGLPLLVLSFHSPSLAPGHTPYVRSMDDLDALYQWFRTVYAYCATLGVRPVTIAEIMTAVER